MNKKIPDAKSIRHARLSSSSPTPYVTPVKEKVKFLLKTGHYEKVKSMALSFDGKKLLTGDVSGWSVLWDVDRAEPLMVFDDVDEAIYSAALSKDAGFAALGTFHKGVYLYDTGTGKLIQRFEKGGNQVKFSRKGKMMVMGGNERPIKLFDTDNFKLIRTFENSSGHTTSFDFSPDDRLLATGDGNTEVKVWDVETGKVIRKYEGLNFWVHGVKFSPDGSKIAAVSYLLKLSKKYDSLVKEASEKEEGSGNLQNDSDDNVNREITDVTVAIWDVKSGNVVKKYVHPKGALCIDYSTDGRFIVTGGADNAFHIFDVEKKEIVHSYGLMNIRFVNTVLFTPDGSKLFFAGGDGIIRLYDLKDKMVVKTFNSIETGINTAIFSPSHIGNYFAGGGDDGKVYIWDYKNNELFKGFSGSAATVEAIAYGDDGRLLLSSGNKEVMNVFNITAGNICRTFRRKDTATVLTLDWNDRTSSAISGFTFGRAVLWDTEKCTRKWEKRIFRGSVLSARFSTDGKLLLLSGAENGNGVINLINPETEETLREYKVKDHPIWKADFLPDEGNIAFCSGRDVTLLDLVEGRTIKVLKGHKGPIWAMALSPDGKYIVSGGFRGEMKIWDVAAGKEIGSVQAHKGEISSLAFGEKGLIISTGKDKKIRLWSIESPDKPLFTIMLLKDYNWIVYNEKGFFKSSKDALNYIYRVEIDGKTYNANDYAAKFNYPDKIKR